MSKNITLKDLKQFKKALDKAPKSSVAVDTELNVNSNNPIANRAVATAISEIQSSINNEWQSLYLSSNSSESFRDILVENKATIQNLLLNSDNRDRFNDIRILATDSYNNIFWITPEYDNRESEAESNVDPIFEYNVLGLFTHDGSNHQELAYYRLHITKQYYESDPTAIVIGEAEKITGSSDGIDRALLPFDSSMAQVIKDRIMATEKNMILQGTFLGVDPADTISSLFTEAFLPALDKQAFVEEVLSQVNLSSNDLIAFFTDPWEYGTYNVMVLPTTGTHNYNFIMDIFTHRDINYVAYFDVVGTEQPDTVDPVVDYEVNLTRLVHVKEGELETNVEYEAEEPYKDVIENLYAPTQFVPNITSMIEETNQDFLNAVTEANNTWSTDINLLMAANLKSYPTYVFRLPSGVPNFLIKCSYNDQIWYPEYRSRTVGEIIEVFCPLTSNIPSSVFLAYPIKITIKEAMEPEVGSEVEGE